MQAFFNILMSANFFDWFKFFSQIRVLGIFKAKRNTFFYEDSHATQTLYDFKKIWANGFRSNETNLATLNKTFQKL